MKLLHTSDWHLGRIFHNQSLLEDQAHILEQIIAYACDHQVNAVLIAGDIFDRAIPPADAIALLDNTLHRLAHELAIPVILISGNHDSAERLAFGARALASQNIHILHDLKNGCQPVIIKDEQHNTAAIYGIPYHTPEQVRAEFNQTCKTFDDAHSFMVQQILANKTAADFQVLMSHCFVDGADACDSERPLAIGGADRVSAGPMKPFDYVALGHLHGQQKRAADHIRYCGTPLKYSFSEQSHKKGVTLVTLEQNQPAIIEQLPLTPLRDMRSLEGELDTLLQQGKNDPHKEDYLAITLTNQHAILDAMAKLRSVYPNVLQLEKTYLHSSTNQQTGKRDIKKNELAIFKDFYFELTENNLTPEQEAYLNEVLTEVHQTMAQGTDQ